MKDLLRRLDRRRLRVSQVAKSPSDTNLNPHAVDVSAGHLGGVRSWGACGLRPGTDTKYIGTAMRSSQHLGPALREPPARQCWSRAISDAAFSAAGSLAPMRCRFGGPVVTVSSTCSSSSDAVAVALHSIHAGDIDVAVVAGLEDWVPLPTLAPFATIGAMSRRPPGEASLASRPFDAERDGFAPSHGGGAVVPATVEWAQGQHLDSNLLILNAASSNDGYHAVAPSSTGAGAVRAMRAALAGARIPTEAIAHINAHRT